MTKPVSFCRELTYLLCLLTGASFGCGGSDDGGSPSDSQRGSGVNASAGKGAGGAAGFDIGSAQRATAEDCLKQSSMVFKDRTDGYGSDCLECVCKESPYAVTLCNDQADDCWGLIGCVREHCAGKEGADESNCAVTSCGQFIEGAGTAMAVGVLLQNDACSDKCTKH